MQHSCCQIKYLSIYLSNSVDYRNKKRCDSIMITIYCTLSPPLRRSFRRTLNLSKYLNPFCATFQLCRHVEMTSSSTRHVHQVANNNMEVTARQVLRTYRRILKAARDWKASSGNDFQSKQEQEYIRNEARRLFRRVLMFDSALMFAYC